ncbi:MAG TPA: SDR family oxidoreductase [Chryseolinea sp.]|nr:SDR family oxidoreductase [Chryseolinea sp.]
MNKLIVVTGGSKGIGRAVIEKFIFNGFDVVTCSRHMDGLQQLETQLRTSFPQSKVFTLKADLSDKLQVHTFCEFVKGLNRSVDVLVNNAGYFIPGQIVKEPDDTLTKMIEANLYSAYYTTRGLIDLLKNGKSRYIFNMCSIASFMAYPNGGSYAISKFALLGFSKCLREELKAEGIRVSAVMPGATRTESWDGTSLPDERFISPQDVADAIFAAYSLSARSVVEEIIIRPQLGDLK